MDSHSEFILHIHTFLELSPNKYVKLFNPVENIRFMLKDMDPCTSCNNHPQISHKRSVILLKSQGSYPKDELFEMV